MTMPPPPLEVSIVMPCLNEAETVGTCVRVALRALAENGVTGEVVVADNGSTDRSQDIAATAGARVVPAAERGYGAALMAGIAAARGRHVIIGDADCSYDFNEIGRFIDALRAGADLVMGCRLPWGGGTIHKGAMPFLHKWLGTPVLTALSRLFFGLRITDINCGMRGFDRAAFTGLDIRTTGMEFASEMVIKAALNKLRIVEVPISLHPDGRSRPPHLRTWRDGWRHLRFMLLYSPRWLFQLPGAILAVLGAAVMALLYGGPRFVGGVGFDIHTYLVAAMCLPVGIQLLSFGSFARTYAVSHGLLPPPADRHGWRVSLEVGLLAGFALVAAGLFQLTATTSYWGSTHFGAIADPMVTRRVVLGATTIVLGVQTISAFFMNAVLALRQN